MSTEGDLQITQTVCTGSADPLELRCIMRGFAGWRAVPKPDEGKACLASRTDRRGL